MLAILERSLVGKIPWTSFVHLFGGSARLCQIARSASDHLINKNKWRTPTHLNRSMSYLIYDRNTKNSIISDPFWKNNSDQTYSCPRDWRLSTSWRPNWGPLWKFFSLLKKTHLPGTWPIDSSPRHCDRRSRTSGHICTTFMYLWYDYIHNISVLWVKNVSIMRLIYNSDHNIFFIFDLNINII